MAEVAFIDSETRSLLDVTVTGAYKYAHHPSTDATVWGFALDDEPGQVWSPQWAWGNARGIRPDAKTPDALLDHVAEGGFVVAWNAYFDRHIWNEVMVKKYGWPVLPLEQVLCAQAQAEANNLPGRLEKAAEALGTPYQKDPKGKALIAQLSNGARDTWDTATFETPSKMGHFRAYCVKDVLSMRDVWQCCRPLVEWEWHEYWASERINDRGVAVDVEFAAAAKEYARAEAADINQRLYEITGDEKLTVTNHIRKARFLYDILFFNEELQKIVERPPRKSSPDRFRYSCDRATREALLDILKSPDIAEQAGAHGDRVVEFLELIEAGNSAAIKKFTAIVNQETGGRVHGGYSFNGAGQTGRFSSRGIQVHNIIRAPLDESDSNRAVDAIEDILAGVEPNDLVDEYGHSISRLLARLIRPTFIAPEGKILVWGDWDQIEARVLPWLARSAGAEAKLDLFRSGQDVYKYAASGIFKCDPDEIDKDQRQIGKVSELALGFGGAVGAYAAMGRGYGLTLPEGTVRQIVDQWRIQNAWCVAFWHELWSAAMGAYSDPGVWYHAGRVKYLYHPDFMRGTLICELPDQRWIVYPQFKHERIIYEDEDGLPQVKWRTSCVKGFGGGYGRVEIWYGTLAENITQATAASFLRRTLVTTQDYCVLHTHDEIVIEVPEKGSDEAAEILHETMTDLPDWADGLPLTASVESGPFYTK